MSFTWCQPRSIDAFNRRRSPSSISSFNSFSVKARRVCFGWVMIIAHKASVELMPLENAVWLLMVSIVFTSLCKDTSFLQKKQVFPVFSSKAPLPATTEKKTEARHHSVLRPINSNQMKNYLLCFTYCLHFTTPPRLRRHSTGQHPCCPSKCPRRQRHPKGRCAL